VAVKSVCACVCGRFVAVIAGFAVSPISEFLEILRAGPVPGQMPFLSPNQQCHCIFSFILFLFVTVRVIVLHLLLLHFAGKPIVQSSGDASGSQPSAATTMTTTKPAVSSSSQQELINILEQVSFRLFIAFNVT